MSFETSLSISTKLVRKTPDRERKETPSSVEMTEKGEVVPRRESISLATNPLVALPVIAYFVSRVKTPTNPAKLAVAWIGSAAVPISRKLASGNDSGRKRLDHQR